MTRTWKEPEPRRNLVPGMALIYFLAGTKCLAEVMNNPPKSAVHPLVLPEAGQLSLATSPHNPFFKASLGPSVPAGYLPDYQGGPS